MGAISTTERRAGPPRVDWARNPAAVWFTSGLAGAGVAAFVLALGSERVDFEPRASFDRDVVQILAHEPEAQSGAWIASALAQVARVLPWRSLGWRVSMLGVLASTALAIFIFLIARRAAMASSGRPIASSAGAALATMWSMSTPAVQRELGGPSISMVAICASLALLTLEFRSPARTRTALVGRALAAGVVMGEELRVGLVLWSALIVTLLVRRLSGSGPLSEVSDATLSAGETRLDSALASAAYLGSLIVALALVGAKSGFSLRAFGVGGGWMPPLELLSNFAEASFASGIALSSMGIVLALLRADARRLVAIVAAAIVVALVLAMAFAAHEPSRSPPPLLFALVLLVPLKAIAMTALARAAERRIWPLRHIPVFFVFVIEAALIPMALDSAIREGVDRPALLPSKWQREVFSRIERDAVVVTTDARLDLRFSAARALRVAPGGWVLVSPRRVHGSGASELVLAHRELAGVVREMIVRGAPTERTLAELAQKKPLYATFEPTWTNTIATHLLPDVLVERVSPSPIGSTDRKAALDETREIRLRALDPKGMMGDPGLVELSRSLARRRALGLAASGGRAFLPEAIRDVREIDESDPMATWLASQMLETRGKIDVSERAGDLESTQSF